MMVVALVVGIDLQPSGLAIASRRLSNEQAKKRHSESLDARHLIVGPESKH
jgi:hypothetical protein